MNGASFWSMGGYARFVWPCFGLGFLVLVGNVWAALRFHGRARVRALRALAMGARR